MDVVASLLLAEDTGNSLERPLESERCRARSGTPERVPWPAGSRDAQPSKGGRDATNHPFEWRELHPREPRTPATQSRRCALPRRASRTDHPKSGARHPIRQVQQPRRVPNCGVSQSRVEAICGVEVAPEQPPLAVAFRARVEGPVRLSLDGGESESFSAVEAADVLLGEAG